ncbi:MAG: NAD(P)(+) transhydrogenase (Re/Si-specific) subunit alpha, partial [Nocardioides sp.]
MRVVVPRETREGETRVSLVPELVALLAALGHEVVVEPGAGHGAQVTDEEYVAVGAVLEADPFPSADLVVSVQPLDAGVVRRLRSGAVTVSFLPVGSESPHLSLVADLRDLGVTSFAMELVPRISRAQSMDALSSQSLVSG